MFGSEPVERFRSQVNFSPENIPRNADYIIVGAIHSHPQHMNPDTLRMALEMGTDPSGQRNEQFSFSDARFAQHHNVPLYLVTPSGVVLQLDPNIPRQEIQGSGTIQTNESPFVSVAFPRIFR